MKTLKEHLDRRPVDREQVDAHKAHMEHEVQAARLAEIRDAQSLTQQALADRTSISQARISKIEHGDLSRTELGTLQKYIEGLGGTIEVRAHFGNDAYLLST